MNTSKTVRLKFTLFDKVYKNVKIIWAKSYFVFTMGINKKIIKKIHKNARQRRYKTNRTWIVKWYIYKNRHLNKL